MSPPDLWTLSQRHAEAQPDRVILDFDGRLWTWSALLEAAERCAAGLAAVGVRSGDVVCQYAPNHEEVIVTTLALLRLGAVECPVNAGLKGEQLGHVLRHSGARCVVADAALAERLVEQLPSAKAVEIVILRGDPVPSGQGFVDYEQVRNCAGSLPDFVTPAVSDPMEILYTSGTTGPAKGVVHPHGFAIETANIKIAQWGLTRDDVLFSALPLYHINARCSTLFTALVVDGRAAIVSSFSAREFWDQVRRSGATEVGVIGAVPSILLLQEPKPNDRDHRVRMMHGAGGVPMERRQEFEERFGARLVSGFSMTETGHFSTTSPDDPMRYRASGIPVPEFDVAIVNDDDEVIPAGQVGELVVRPGRPWAMMTRYHNDPEATLAAFRNLWFHTGDLARFSEDGYLHWVDRKKDAIRRRGEMISSSELERTGLSYPGVEECVAIGVPAELGEEEVKLIVVPSAGAQIDVRDFARHCAEQLPDFAAPRFVEVVAEVPRGPTHKVEKAKLREKPFSEGTVDLAPSGRREKAP